MLNQKINPGDLVKGLYKTGRNGIVLTGIIIKESERTVRTNHSADKTYVWWWVLTNEGELIEDVEGCFEKICE